MSFVIENVIATTESLRLVSTDGHEVRVELKGDCCSRSFFDNYSLIDARGLMGERLVDIEDVDRAVDRTAPESDPYKDGCDVIEYHALIIRTDKQSITVDWRNDSNGYYSGTAHIFFNGEPCRVYNWDTRITSIAETLAAQSKAT